MKIRKQKIFNIFFKLMGIIFISVILGFSYNKIVDNRWTYQVSVKISDKLLSNLRQFDNLLVYLAIKPLNKSIDHYVIRDLNEYSSSVIKKFPFITNITLTQKYFVITSKNKKLNQDDLNELKNYVNNSIKNYIIKSAKDFYKDGINKHEDYRLLQIQKITDFVSLYDKLIEEKVKEYERFTDDNEELQEQTVDSFNSVIVRIIDDFNIMLKNPSDEDNLENRLLKISKKRDLVNTKIVRENVDILISQLKKNNVSQDIFFVELRRLMEAINKEDFFVSIKTSKVSNKKASLSTSILAFFVVILSIAILIIYLVSIFSKKSLQKKIVSLLNQV